MMWESHCLVCFRGYDLERTLVLYGTVRGLLLLFSTVIPEVFSCHTAPIVIWEGVLFPAGRKEA